MKKYLTILFAAFSLVSCDSFLYTDEATFQTKEYQFRNFENCKQVATNVYGYLRSYLMDTEGTMREAATDNAIYAWERGNIKTYYDGSWSGTKLIDDVWSHYYSAIRAANYFLENCPDEFPGAELSDNYQKHLEEMRCYKKEVRALRAYFHFELLKRYGSICIIDRSMTMDEINLLKPKSYDDVADWIVGELDPLINNEVDSLKLPLTYKGTLSEEIGRITRGGAAAIKARTLLYKASPLNNTSEDKNIWLEAAIAAKELIEMDGSPYKLRPESEYNNEASYDVIIGIRKYPDNSFEVENFPMGEEGAEGGICPSQNLVEAFDFSDGTEFDWDEHKDVALDFSLRDTRLARTVYCNGSDFKDHQLQTYIGGLNGLPKSGATPTSYYLHKFIQEETSLLSGNVTNFHHYVPLYRLAEVYLNYAEALFEATGDPDFKGSKGGVGFKMSPVEAVNKVRSRSKVGSLPAGLSPEEFRRLLRKERRCETAFEDHRFWDLRRWKIAGDNKDIYGLTITADSEGKVTSVTRGLVQTRYWDDKYNFYPISDSERNKNNNLPAWGTVVE